MVNKVITKNGIIIYRNEKNQYHREDGPAIKYFHGGKNWYINALFHRIDGPAIEFNSYKEYFIMGKQYSYEDWLVIKNYPLLW